MKWCSQSSCSTQSTEVGEMMRQPPIQAKTAAPKTAAMSGRQGDAIRARRQTHVTGMVCSHSWAENHLRRPGVTIEEVVNFNSHRSGATWLRRGCGIEERVPRFHFLVNPVENSQLRILTTLSLLNNQ